MNNYKQKAIYLVKKHLRFDMFGNISRAKQSAMITLDCIDEVLKDNIGQSEFDHHMMYQNQIRDEIKKLKLIDIL